VNGLGFDQDRLIVAHGRLPNPRSDEFIMDSAAVSVPAHG
jgi:hypothetical protein